MAEYKTSKSHSRVATRSTTKLHTTETEVPQHWLKAIDLRILARSEPALPQMIIDDWLPSGYATLMAGHGGIGKSSIALHLAVCIALGRSFFGLPVQKRKVLYLSCEDRKSVLHWRLSRICEHMGIYMGDLDGRLNILDLVGQDTVLFERDPKSGDVFTRSYRFLKKHIEEHEIDLLIVDGIADTFGGNENSRSEVKRFVNALISLVPMNTGAVLLIGHVSKPVSLGITTSEGYSGSTSWHNTVRARWYLHPEIQTSEDGDRPERNGEYILELQKSNLGRSDRSMRFKWDDKGQLFVGREVIGTSVAERKIQDQDEQRGILAALKSVATAGSYVPAATSGRRTAYHVLCAQAEFPKSLRGKAGIKRFWRHIEELRTKDQIREGVHLRADRKKTITIELSDAGRTDDAANAANI